jgi:hypothetical protein
VFGDSCTIYTMLNFYGSTIYQWNRIAWLKHGSQLSSRQQGCHFLTRHGAHFERGRHGVSAYSIDLSTLEWSFCVASPLSVDNHLVPAPHYLTPQ